MSIDDDDDFFDQLESESRRTVHGRFRSECYRLKPSRYYGLMHSIENDLQFVDNFTVIHLVSRVIIFEDLVQQTQSYIKVKGNSSVINIMKISPNRELIAISEKSREEPFISLYSVKTKRRVQILKPPSDGTFLRRFAAIGFTLESDTLIAVTGPPESHVIFYDLESGDVTGTINLTSYLKNPKAAVHQVICNPVDQNNIIVSGYDYFQMFKFGKSKKWSPYGFSGDKSIVVTCACWVSEIIAIVGTKDGRLIFLEFGHVQGIFKACDVDLIDLADEEVEKSVSMSNSDTSQSNWEIDDVEIRGLIGFEKGFAFSCCRGEVIIFTREEEENYMKWKRRGAYICNGSAVGLVDPKLVDVIKQIVISPSEHMIACTTLRHEIFYGRFEEDFHSKHIEEVEFKKLFGDIHQGPILNVSFALWKSLAITAGAVDRRVIVWDYETNSKIYMRQFHDEIHSVCIHPTGIFCLLGFTDTLRLCIIMINGIKSVRMVPIRACSMVEFSSGGHLFAAANNAYIHIYNSITLECIYTFKGHGGTIRCIRFASHDYEVFSTGDEGCVFKWDAQNGQRSLDLFLPGCVTYDLQFFEKKQLLYLVGTDGYIRLSRFEEVNKEFNLKYGALFTIKMSTCKKKVFAAGVEGVILSIPYPIFSPVNYKEYCMHTNPIKRIAMSPDDKKLMSVSDDGSVCFWNIEAPKHQNVSTSQLSLVKNENLSTYNYVVIGLRDWTEQQETKEDLASRIKESIKENEFILWQAHSNFVRVVKATHDELTKEVGRLEAKFNVLDRAILEMRGWRQESPESDDEVEEMEIKLALQSNPVIEGCEKLIKKYDEKLISIQEGVRNALKEFASYKNQYLFQEVKTFHELEQELLTVNKMYDEFKDYYEQFVDEKVEEGRKTVSEKLDEIETSNAKLRTEIDFLTSYYYRGKREIEHYKFKWLQAMDKRKQQRHIARENNKVLTRLNRQCFMLNDILSRKQNALEHAEFILESYVKHKEVMDEKVSKIVNLLEPRQALCRSKMDLYHKLENTLAAKNRIIQRRYRRYNRRMKLYRQIRKKMIYSWKKSESLNRIIRRIENDITNKISRTYTPKAFKRTFSRIAKQYEKKYLGVRNDAERINEVKRQLEHLEQLVQILKGHVKSKAMKKYVFKHNATNRISRAVRNLIKNANDHIYCTRLYNEKLSDMRLATRVDSPETFSFVKDRLNVMTDQTRKHIDSLKEQIWDSHTLRRLFYHELLRWRYILDINFKWWRRERKRELKKRALYLENHEKARQNSSLRGPFSIRSLS